MLDRINSDVRSKSGVNQWRNMPTVLEWFSNFQEKNKLSFLVFNTVDFYHSLSEDLLKKCLTWARKYTGVSDTKIDTIMHVQQTLLHDQKKKKKNGNCQFDCQ